MYGRQQSENIMSLVPHRQTQQRKPAMHRSRHDPRTKPTGSTFSAKRTDCGTFGNPVGKTAADTRQYLRKGRAEALRKKNQMAVEAKFRDIKKEKFKSEKAAVPNRKERPVMGLQSTKNYLTANAVEAILAVPGNRARIVEQQPQYQNKADFGKVPGYLNDVKQEIHRENKMIEEYLGANEPGGNQYDDEYGDYDDNEEVDISEINVLIDALKQKWGVVNKQYQLITHQVKLDTIGKVRRKEKNEKELIQLEKDIQDLEEKKQAALGIRK